MKKFLFVLGLLMFQVTVAQELEKSLLWKVSGNGLKKPSYLYGTMHITCDTLLNKKVEKALKSTEEVYLELSEEDMKMDEKSMVKMMKYIMMKDGNTISSQISKEDFAKLDSLLRNDLGVPAVFVDKYYPTIVSLITTYKDEMVDCPYSVEQVVTNRAKNQGKAIYGLETMDDQMKVMISTPMELQIEELLKYIHGEQEDDNRAGELYALKDVDAMAEMDGEVSEDFIERFLINRNKNWVKQIHVLTVDKSIFFAVGAAHLGGEYGLIRLLRKAGYKVQAAE